MDKAFEADGNDSLDQAFKNIVNEIILQSAYYPTEVETGNIPEKEFRVVIIKMSK